MLPLVAQFALRLAEAGTYNFRFHNRHDFADSTEENDCFTRLDGGDCFTKGVENLFASIDIRAEPIIDRCRGRGESRLRPRLHRRTA